MSSFKKYPKVFTLGHKENEGILRSGALLHISEKVDGTNVRFKLRKGEVVYGTHNTQIGALDLVPKKHLQRPVCEYIDARIKADDLKPNYTYFGEGYGEGLKHTISYENPAAFVGFDVWLETSAAFKVGESVGRFMSAGAARKEFERLGLPFVPTVFEGKENWSHDTLRALIGKSAYGDFEMEGIVIKAYDKVNKYGRQMMAKIVTDDFKEANKAAFGAAKKHQPLEQQIFNAYCTEPRIKKKYHALLEEGEERGMHLVPKLGALVFADILDEEIHEIAKLHGAIDLGVVRGLVLKECARSLKWILVEGELEGNEDG